MKKKIIVIGAGIAGLNAGVELLQHGYDVAIYEKNDDVGGLCYGYTKDGYSIDACFHWLMGTKPHTVIHNLWTNIGALNDDVEISNLPYFATFVYEGTTVTFGRNLAEEEARWKAISPEDEKAISAFFESVRGLASLWELTQKDEHGIKPDMKLIAKLPNPGRILMAMKQTRKAYAKQFRHPALRFALENAMTGYNNAFFFLQVYGLFSTGDGNVPLGGAYPFVQRIKERYLSLGGELLLNTPVERLNVEGGSIASIQVGDQKITGDYFIAAMDPNYVFAELLDGKYGARMYKQLEKHIADYTVSGCFCVYLKVKDFAGDIATPTAIPIDPVKVGKKNVDALLIRPYAFDTVASRKEATVISLFVDQDQEDYIYFQYHDHPEKEHRRVVEELVGAFLKAYPQYEDKTSVLDSFGPLELGKQTNTSYGSIQSYSFTDKGMFFSYRGRITAIDNLYICGQWNRPIGGTPTALLTSHEIVGKLLRREKYLEYNPTYWIKKRAENLGKDADEE